MPKGHPHGTGPLDAAELEEMRAERDAAIEASPYVPRHDGEEGGLEPDPIPPDTTAQLEALRQAMAELTRANADRDRREDALRRELEENQALVSRFLAEQNTIDMVAIQAKWARREQARRKIYEYVAGKKVVIMIHRNRDERLNHDVHLNLNGNFYNVKPGAPTELPGEFLEVLDHASVNSFISEVDDSGNPKMQVLDYFSYPYQVLHGLEGMPAGEIAATH